MNVLTGTPLLPTYARFPVTFVDGEGSWLIADDGQRYLDLVAGIAVVSLGHCHPAPLEAAKEQLERLWHVSNLYSTEPMENLARALSERFGGAHAFFCNSGHRGGRGGAQVGAQVDRQARARRARGLVPRADDGRALDHRAAGKKRAPFEPLVPGVRFATPETLADAVGAETAAIVLEPVLGEGGVHPLSTETLEEARSLADENDAMLIFDEVQTGVGRTGEFFAWQRHGVRPDALTLAKGLANGLPIGALLVSDTAPTGFVPGDHASTFGGNPVSCAAACAVVETIDDDLLAHVRAIGERFEAQLRGRPWRRPAARGRARPAGRARSPTRRSSTTCSSAPPARPRSASRPPLTISEAEADLGIDLLRETLAMTTKFERQGAILRPRRDAPHLDPGRARRGAPRTRASTRCRRPSRATSPSSGS